jgi:hypothetical protein
MFNHIVSCQLPVDKYEKAVYATVIRTIGPARFELFVREVNILQKLLKTEKLKHFGVIETVSKSRPCFLKKAIEEDYIITSHARTSIAEIRAEPPVKWLDREAIL